MNTTTRDPLLERLDEILKRHLTIDLRQQSVISFNARVIRMEGELRALMADVAIEYLNLHWEPNYMGGLRKYEAEKIRQRFGVGVEEKAP